MVAIQESSEAEGLEKRNGRESSKSKHDEDETYDDRYGNYKTFPYAVCG